MIKVSAQTVKTKAMAELEHSGLKPKYVERPATESDVERIVKHANLEGLTVLPIGGGTALGYAPLPADLDIVLDMTGLAGALAFRPLDLTMAAQAGMTADAINEFLREQGKGFFLPLDPPQSDQATLGGIYASQSSGPLRHRYGTLRDQALGIGAVNAQGGPLGFGGQTVKNVAGYDLTKFFMGSAGRLCIVTKISFRIQPLPEASSLCENILQDERALRDVLSGLRSSFMIPSAVVLTHSSGGRSGFFRMLTAFEGHPKAVERQNKDLLQLVFGAGGSGHIHCGREAMLRGLRTATDPNGQYTLRLKVCVPTVHGPSAYSALGHLADDLGLRIMITLLAGNGVLYLYARHAEDSTFQRFSQGIQEIVLTHNGHVSLIRAPRELMSTWGPWLDPTLRHHIFRPIKETMDPKGIFPPLP